MAEPATTPRRVVLSTVRSDAHTWNLTYLQLLLEEHGHTVVNLGPCVVDATVVRAVRDHAPDAVVVSTVNGHGRLDGTRLVAALRADPGTRRVPVVIGGKLGIAAGEMDDDAALLDAGFDAVFPDDAEAGELLGWLAGLPAQRPADGCATAVRAVPDLADHVARARAAGLLVVQPRMGMADPGAMAEGLRAVAQAGASTVGTITLDSYTRVGDHASARQALAAGQPLNGFPLVVHGAAVTAEVVRAGQAGPCPVPVQVRHGSAVPQEIFRTAVRAGLNASEGGPVSYCLPYGRVPLAESVRHWDEATRELAATAPGRAHLETFGGCMLGQLCPPSMLVAISVLEALFFVERGIPTVSLSYAQQTDARQDLEALAALRRLAEELLPSYVRWHVVLYTYMGVHPRTPAGAERLLRASAALAVRGGAERLIVKTAAESRRIPTVAENVAALELAAAAAAATRPSRSEQLDGSMVLTEARALVSAVLDGGDTGRALVRAFASGTLDLPFCLHPDNMGLTQAEIDADGRLRWTRVGRLPLPAIGGGTRRKVRANELLGMLRHTADTYDGLATSGPAPDRPSPRTPTVDAVASPAVPPGRGPYTVAIVGSGPRGLAVLERLAARFAADPPRRPVDVWLVDRREVGCGRVWRTDQPPWFVMNTVADEVTMFSGAADDGPARPGAGPTLAQWWGRVDPAASGDGYAPRALYGRYLRFLLDAVERDLPAGVALRRLGAEVTDLTTGHGGYVLTTADGHRLSADRVVLATGHPRPLLDPEQRRFATFARRHPGLRYVRGDSAADMPLDALPAGSTVGVIGLGLSFYDVMAALTVGRGGSFATEADGTLRYQPSGDEPLLVAGSRSGAPLPARGHNQKPPDFSYPSRICTVQRVERMRRDGLLDFRRDVLPLVLAEMRLVYYAAEVRRRFGGDVAERFAAQLLASTDDPPSREAVERLAAAFGVTDLPPLDLTAWREPFGDRSFGDRAGFRAALTEFLRADIAEALAGNVDGPRKAACDVLRDVRHVLRAAVDFSGLTPQSHQRDFLDWFTPLSSFLAAGPPLVRLRQVGALVDCGLLRVLGPRARFDTDVATGRFVAWSPQVAGSRVKLDTLVDARIPQADLRTDVAALTTRLRASGLLTCYANRSGGSVFDTGGVAVTEAPYHPVRADGGAERGLYVLGIPTEHTRWFTQVGSGRPGHWTQFTRDADAIAADILAGLAAPALVPTAGTEPGAPRRAVDEVAQS